MMLERGEDCSLPALVGARVATDPDKVAVSELESSRSLTWRQLHEEGLTCASALASLGVGKGDFVLLMQGNNITGWITQLGTADLGAVEVPVNPAYVGAWLDHVIETSGAHLAVVDQKYLDQWLPLVGKHPNLRSILVVSDEPVLERIVEGTRLIGYNEALGGRDRTIDAPVTLTAGDLATILWTSGTTGKSKGVLMPWGQWWHRLAVSNLLPDGLVGDDDVLFQPWPTFHVGGRQTLYHQAVHGGSSVLRDGFSATAWFEHIQQSGATWAFLIGAAPQLIMNTPMVAGERDSALRLVLAGPSSPLVEEICDRFGIDFYTSYGMTEINNPFNSANYRITKENWSSCGELHPSRTVRLVDSAGRDVEDGEVGELLVLDERDKHAIAHGYLGPQELTDSTWYDGWFHTGDLFRRDETGKYFFVDRLKDAIRRGGENISSAEVEAAINLHPAVAESAVVAAPSELAEQEVAAYIVMTDGAIDYEEIYRHIEQTVPKFARPRYLVEVKALPRTPSQKIRKAELRTEGLPPNTWDAKRDHRVSAR